MLKILHIFLVCSIISSEVFAGGTCDVHLSETLIDPSQDQIIYEASNLRHRGRVKVSVKEESGQVILEGINLTHNLRVVFKSTFPSSSSAKELAEALSVRISEFYNAMSYHQYLPSPLVEVIGKKDSILSSKELNDAFLNAQNQLPKNLNPFVELSQ